MTDNNCLLCCGEGWVIERKARQIGYTFGLNEPLDGLEEKIIPCPLCTKVIDY